nr:DUF1120 domain-containing protein [uncultured Pseudomonas sp.]
MKAPFFTLATAWLMISATSALAASSVDLAVKGSITPSACIPTLLNGVVDYGKLSAKDLNANIETLLPPAEVQMSVNCEAKTLFALEPHDNRARFAQGGFGLTEAAPNVPLGGYYLGVKSHLADGAVITRMHSRDAGKTWRASQESDGIVMPYWTAFGDSSTGVPAPIPVKDLNLSLEVVTYINAAQSLPLTEEVTIDGSATLEVRYL